MLNFFYTQLFVKPTYPTQSFKGQTCIVTGSNVGLGLEAARHLARLDAAKVILAVRNLAAGEEAKLSIEQSTACGPTVVEVWELDLSSYKSVIDFAKRATDTLPRIDVLMENAGIATNKFSMAEDDERTITVNVVSTFLLALLMLPKLQETATTFNVKPRLTIVSSEVHGFTNFRERSAAPNIFPHLSNEKKADMMDRYPVSKLLEVLTVRHIAPLIRKSCPDVILNMLNPGLCHSALSRDSSRVLEVIKFFLARTTEVGARTLVASAAAGEDSHGKYMSDGVIKESALSNFSKSEEGRQTGKNVWEELSQKLEKIQPGVTKVVS